MYFGGIGNSYPSVLHLFDDQIGNPLAVLVMLIEFIDRTINANLSASSSSSVWS